MMITGPAFPVIVLPPALVQIRFYVAAHALYRLPPALCHTRAPLPAVVLLCRRLTLPAYLPFVPDYYCLRDCR